MRIHKVVSSLFSATFAAVCLLGSTANAQIPPTAAPPSAAPAVRDWDWTLMSTPAAGLTNCILRVWEIAPSSAPGAVNVVPVFAPGQVSVVGEAGKLIGVKLECPRGSSYSSSAGGGTWSGSDYPVATATPAATAGGTSPVGTIRPLGMFWTQPIGSSEGKPLSVIYTGGGNTITVTTYPKEAPASPKLVSDTVTSAITDYSYRSRRIIGLGVGKTWGLDTDNGRQRTGVKFFLEAYVPVFGATSDLRLSLGVGGDHENGFKPVRNAPNLQPVGADVDMSSLYIGPHVGLNLLHSFNESVGIGGNLRLGLGYWGMYDGTTVESQTAVSKDVFIGPAENDASFAGKLNADFGLVFWHTLNVGVDFTVLRTFTPVGTFRGPELPGYTRSLGFKTNVNLGGVIGVTF